MPTNIGKRDMEQSFRSKNIEKSGAENKTKQSLQQGSEKKGKPRIMLGIFVALFILMFFAGMALAGGIYFKVIDLAKWSQQYKLYQLPVVGKYMPQMPQTNFEPVEQQGEKPVENLAQQQPQMLPSTNPIAQEQPKVNEEQKQKEAAKALSKTSRTYASMSPEQAVPILNKLDDDTVLVLLSKMEDEQVAKLLGAMQSQRAAVLTSKMMMKKQ